MPDMTQNKDKGYKKGVKNTILICKHSTSVGIILKNLSADSDHRGRGE